MNPVWQWPNLAAPITQSPPDRTADVWADTKRKLGSKSAKSGDWSSKVTAYTVPIARAFSDPRVEAIVATIATQMGKSETMRNVMGHRLDDDPVTIIFIAPGDLLLKQRISPKIQDMLKRTPDLWEKTAKGHKFKLLHMVVNGVDLLLASSGSSSQLSETPAGLVIMDELDEMKADKSITGTVWEQAEARLGTFADGKIAAISSPTEGIVKSAWNKDTGLEHWVVEEPAGDDEDVMENPVQSPIWLKWQEGSRHQTAAPCPSCNRYFIPYSHQLKWPAKATPRQIRLEAWLECPNCKRHIETREKRWMIERTMPVAPGQHLDAYDERRPEGIGIDQEFTEFGDYRLPPDFNGTWSLNTNGLLSFAHRRTFGHLAQGLHKVRASGDPARIQTKLNKDFGECYGVRGERPEIAQVMACKDKYKRGDIPPGVSMLSLGVDCSDDRLWWVLLGWGPKFRCWMIDYGQTVGRVKGAVSDLQVWTDLDELRQSTWDGMKITVTGIDSGDHRDPVYAFCKPRLPRCLPLKGGSTRLTAEWVERPCEKLPNGKDNKYGMHLVTFDTVVYKDWLYERVRLNADKENRIKIDRENQDVVWRIPEDTEEQYAKHITAEKKVKGINGAPDKYVQVFKLNHWLDANSLARMAMVRERNGKPVLTPVGYQPQKQTAPVKKSPQTRTVATSQASSDYMV